ALYTNGLCQLRTKLEYKYTLNNVDTILYALAVDINCVNIYSSNLNDKLTCFYSNIKYSICYRLDDFFITKGIITAALVLLELEANISSYIIVK
ncbi:hypothetical protein K469DRAFT_613205, partial [Zopfia rhizophila CBS 207.26]